jgi:hypothetical protein
LARISWVSPEQIGQRQVLMSQSIRDGSGLPVAAGRGAWARGYPCPSPDVRLGHRARGSLGCRRRFAILASLGGIRRLSGTGSPSPEFRPVGASAN